MVICLLVKRIHLLQQTIYVLQLFQIMSKSSLSLIEDLQSIVTSPCHSPTICIALSHFINSKTREHKCICIGPICLVKLVEKQIREQEIKIEIDRYRSNKYTVLHETCTHFNNKQLNSSSSYKLVDQINTTQHTSVDQTD